MARGGPSFLGSVLLHAGVAALTLVSWPSRHEAPREMLASVPVSIVSEMTVAAAAPDNPAEELIEEDGAASPETPAETPPEPVPEPTPPLPRTEPQPKTTPRTEPERSRPPQPQPQPREQPGLSPEEVEAMSRRPQTGNPAGRPPTGDRGTNSAPRAMGQADLQSISGQIQPHWNPPCHLPGIEQLSVSVEVRMSEDGRLIGQPRPRNPRSDATWRAASDSILRAIRIPPRYRMPAGYEEQNFIITFPLDQACRNR